VQGTVLALVVGTLDLQRPVVLALDLDGLGDGVHQGALGALDGHLATVDLHLDP
jgi:hypothetical protein